MEMRDMQGAGGMDPQYESPATESLQQTESRQVRLNRKLQRMQADEGQEKFDMAMGTPVVHNLVRPYGCTSVLLSSPRSSLIPVPLYCVRDSQKIPVPHFRSCRRCCASNGWQHPHVCHSAETGPFYRCNQCANLRLLIIYSTSTVRSLEVTTSLAKPMGS